MKRNLVRELPVRCRGVVAAGERWRRKIRVLPQFSKLSAVFEAFATATRKMVEKRRRLCVPGASPAINHAAQLPIKVNPASKN